MSAFYDGEQYEIDFLGAGRGACGSADDDADLLQSTQSGWKNLVGGDDETGGRPVSEVSRCGGF